MDGDREACVGSDGTGVITVVVDRYGTVTDVAVDPAWREKVKPDELGLAISTAANEALTGRLADEIEHAELVPSARRETRGAGGDPSSSVAQDLKTEIVGLLAAFERDLETYCGQLREAANTTASGRGPKGAIEVTMGHGWVTLVAVHPSWATSARHTDVRVEALGAFTEAERRLAAVAPSAVTPPPTLVRLRELASDPRALSRELGLS